MIDLVAGPHQNAARASSAPSARRTAAERRRESRGRFPNRGRLCARACRIAVDQGRRSSARSAAAASDRRKRTRHGSGPGAAVVSRIGRRFGPEKSMAARRRRCRVPHAGAATRNRAGDVGARTVRYRAGSVSRCRGRSRARPPLDRQPSPVALDLAALLALSTLSTSRPAARAGSRGDKDRGRGSRRAATKGQIVECCGTRLPDPAAAPARHRLYPARARGLVFRPAADTG